MPKCMIKMIKKYQHHKALMLVDQLLWRMAHHRTKASAAELAYFTLLSLFPFFVVLLNVFSRLSSAHAGNIADIIAVFPAGLRPILQSVIEDVRLGFGSDLQLLIAIAGALYSASLGIRPMIRSCNLAFEVKEPQKGLGLIIKGLIFTVAFVGLIVLLFITEFFGHQVFEWLFDFFNLTAAFHTVTPYIRYLIIPSYMSLLIFLLNRYSLDKQTRKMTSFWSVLPGAVTSSLLMLLLSYLFSVQIAYSNRYAVTYGSISNVIMLIVWLYLIGTALMIGFEINGALYDLKLHPETAGDKSVLKKG